MNGLRWTVALILVGTVWVCAADPPAESLLDRVERLVQKLGDDEFVERERAQEELLKIGPDAYDSLQAAIEHDDIEIATRARYLVRLIRVDWTRESDSAQVKELLKGYDQLPTATRLERATELARLPDDEGLSALCRIVRFEKTPTISKQAALKLLGQPLAGTVTAVSRRRLILDSLGRSTTAATNWLRLEAETLADPSAAVDGWAKAIAEEQATLSRNPQTTHNDIVASLLRRQVDLLMKLMRHEEAQAAMIKSLDYEQGTAESLPKLLAWLVEQKAWQALDVVVKRFADRFDQQPILHYLVADARQKQGQPDLAEAAVKKALEANGPNQVEHYRLASDLQNRGMTEWAIGEYRAAIEAGPPATVFTYASQSSMAELLHDHERHLEAAKALQPAVDELERNAEFRSRINRDIGGIKSRMHYFYAMDHKGRQEWDKVIEQLDKAIASDPTDADALIALHRLPNQDQARREQTSQLIKSAAEVFRKQIQESLQGQQGPEDAGNYNQFAWLIGNTEGDYAEAVRYSHKSLELKPGTAGYLDTLGRCYYAVGDFANAIKYQTQAVTLDPHSGAMQRQLAMFKAEQAKKENK